MNKKIILILCFSLFSLTYTNAQNNEKKNKAAERKEKVDENDPLRKERIRRAKLYAEQKSKKITYIDYEFAVYAPALNWCNTALEIANKELVKIERSLEKATSKKNQEKYQEMSSAFKEYAKILQEIIKEITKKDFSKLEWDLFKKLFAAEKVMVQSGGKRYERQWFTVYELSSPIAKEFYRNHENGENNKDDEKPKNNKSKNEKKINKKTGDKNEK